MNTFTYISKIDKIAFAEAIIPDVQTRLDFLKALEIQRNKSDLPQIYGTLEHILMHERKDVFEMFKKNVSPTHQYVLDNFDTICDSFIDY